MLRDLPLALPNAPRGGAPLPVKALATLRDMNAAADAARMRMEAAARAFQAAPARRPSVIVIDFVERARMAERMREEAALRSEGAIREAAEEAAAAMPSAAFWRILREVVAGREVIVRQTGSKHAIIARRPMTIVDLMGERRTPEIVAARQYAMWRARTELKRTYPEISRRFGGRDHTTAMHAFRRVQAALDAGDASRFTGEPRP